jgi:hypothetical protein
MPNLNSGPNLIRYFKIDEPIGSTILTCYATANTGIIISGATVITSGYVGNGVKLDQVDDYIDIGAGIETSGLSGISIALWYYPLSLSNYDSIVEKYSSANFSNYLRLGGPGVGDTTCITYGVNNPLVGEVFTSGIILINRWHHICGVFDGSLSAIERYKIFYNGISQPVQTGSTFTGFAATTHAGAQNFLVGAGAGLNINRYLGAIVDEVRIYNRALNSGEVYSIYRGSHLNYPSPNMMVL